MYDVSPAAVSLNAGTLGFFINSPEVVYNWLQIIHLSNSFGDRLGRRFEYYTILACLAPAMLLTQLYYFLATAKYGSRLLPLNTQIILSSFVSLVWLLLVLLQLAIGIRHNSYREEIIHDM